jgi:hypothetical protein
MRDQRVGTGRLIEPRNSSDTEEARIGMKHKLTLDRPATYQIKVPGQLDANWSDWVGNMAIALDCESEEFPVTTLTGVVTDQAALQGLLRRLYSLGLPLVSVVCLECGEENDCNACRH